MSGRFRRPARERQAPPAAGRAARRSSKRGSPASSSRRSRKRSTATRANGSRTLAARGGACAGGGGAARRAAAAGGGAGARPAEDDRDHGHSRCGWCRRPWRLDAGDAAGCRAGCSAPAGLLAIGALGCTFAGWQHVSAWTAGAPAPRPALGAGRHRITRPPSAAPWLLLGALALTAASSLLDRHCRPPLQSRSTPDDYRLRRRLV